MIVLDRYTRWLQSFASAKKDAKETAMALERFVGPQCKPQHVYTDNSGELLKAVKRLGWPHDTSTPHRPQTNGVVERAVRVVKEGTACALVQSGLSDKWWPEAMNCFLFLRNAVTVLEDGSTAYKNRFGADFKGPLIPFGASVHYLPITPKDKARTHQFGSKLLRGVFLGYSQQSGGGWGGDLLIADWEALASVTPDQEGLADFPIKRFRHKEVTPIMNGENFIFPAVSLNGDSLGDGANPTELTRSGPFKGGSSPPTARTIDDDGSAEADGDEDADQDGKKVDPDMPAGKGSEEEDFWSFNGDDQYGYTLVCHHRVPRTSLFVPNDSNSPLLTKYLDVERLTYTSLETLSESRIEDCWNLDGEKELSDSWTGKTVFFLLHPPEPGFVRVRGRKTKVRTTERPGNILPEIWTSMTPKGHATAKEFWKTYGPHLENARKERGIYFFPGNDEDFPKVIQEIKEKLKVPKPPAMPLLSKRAMAKLSSLKSGSLSGAATKLGHSPSTSPLEHTLCASVSSSKRNRKKHDSHQEHVAPRGAQPPVASEWFACVHTPVPIPKALRIPEAREALEAEWTKLERKKAWDISKVRPKAAVIREAKAQGRSVHFGSLMDLCHLKNSQMGEEFWSYKGRIVFRGDIVKDEQGTFAVFSEQGASASNMAAAKFMDAIARMPGCDGEDSDAKGAHTQVSLQAAKALLGDDVVTETWISLPPHRRPKSWAHIEDPVCPLLLNLYGHPLAGLLWELYQEDILLKVGFEKVKSWECLYVHRAKQLFLSAYVDDYKMAGKKCNIGPMWDTLRSHGLDLEPSVSLKSNVYLGCGQREVQPDMTVLRAKCDMIHRLCRGSADVGKPTASNIPELKEPSEKPAPKSKTNKKKKAASPTSEGALGGASQENSVPKTSNSNKPKASLRASSGSLNGASGKAPKISAYCYEMFGHVHQTVDRYLELSGRPRESLNTKAATPCIDDHLIPAEEFDVKGHLSPIAARVVLKALYVARIARYDFMWTVNMLAREVTRWTQACDRRLHRLVQYMHQTAEYAQLCFVGDAPGKCWLAMFSDASFAGDLRDSKSTSGGILCLVGPNTFVPISWICKKQGAVSHSTAEAEVISLDAGVRLEGLPALSLWSLVIDVFEPNPMGTRSLKMQGKIADLTHQERLELRRQTLDTFGSIDFVPPSLPICWGRGELYALEDNDAVIKMCVKGRSPNLRHVARTHRVDLDWLFDRVKQDPGLYIKYVGTKEQMADILTKGSFTADAWNSLLQLCLIIPPSSRTYLESIKTLK